MNGEVESTRLKLGWRDTGDGMAPDCDRCADRLAHPHMLGALASVGIEHGLTTGQMARRYLDGWHARGHREVTR